MFQLSGIATASMLILTLIVIPPQAWNEVPWNWKYLSPDEKAAVDRSLKLIWSHRMQNVSLTVLDEAGRRYNGTIRIKQDSTSFKFLVGHPWHFEKGAWALKREYFALTPSKSGYIYAPWKVVERVRGYFDFTGPNYQWEVLSSEGVTDFHIEVGPYLTSGQIAEWNSLPGWAKPLDFDSLKDAMKKYVAALVTYFKGRVQNYHLWPEANAYYGNGGWPIERIIDVIKMEALTIRALDPSAKIYVDLDNITPRSLSFLRELGGPNSWTTEYFIERLLAAEVPFDVIGIEPHYGDGSAQRAGGLDSLYNRLAELGRFGKPIYIWEDGPASFIERRYLTDQGWWAPRYLWHGIPTEEKQAEYMVAETIIALGNPLVMGLRFAWLYDEPNDPLFWHRYNGVIYANGTRKLAFSALEQLWRGFMVDLAATSRNGEVGFKGLPGDYTIMVNGYSPVKIRVQEGISNPSLVITLSAESRATITLTETVTVVRLGTTTVTATLWATTTQLVTPIPYGLITLAIGALSAAFALLAFALRARERRRHAPSKSTC